MKKNILVTAVFVVLLASCLKEDTGEKREKALSKFEDYISKLMDSGVDLVKTENGAYYELKKSPVGEKPEAGDLIVADITSRVIGGSVYFTSNLDTATKYNIVDNSYEYRPYRFFHWKGFTLGFNDALSEMGDSAELNIYVPTDLGYDYVDYTPNYPIPAFSNLLYNVKIEVVTSDPDAYEWENLENYLVENDIALDDTTENGIYFQWIETSDGDTVKIGDNVSVKYKGYFLDGIEFDNNANSEPLKFTVGTTSIIAGFNYGLLEMTYGSKARFIIPYQYAYGVNGKSSPYFPPYSTVIFEVELLE